MSDAPHSLLPADIHEPYIGLKPYTEAERDRFFGRERDAQLLINKLFSHPLTLLYAPSGVGKTSLLRALVMLNFHKDMIGPADYRHVAAVLIDQVVTYLMKEPTP